MGELRGGQKSPEEEDEDLEIPRNVANDEELLTAQDVRWIYERRGLLKKRDKGEGPQHFHELIKDCQMVRNYPLTSWFSLHLRDILDVPRIFDLTADLTGVFHSGMEASM